MFSVLPAGAHIQYGPSSVTLPWDRSAKASDKHPEADVTILQALHLFVPPPGAVSHHSGT